jgi:serine/threonine protein kinase
MLLLILAIYFDFRKIHSPNLLAVFDGIVENNFFCLISENGGTNLTQYLASNSLLRWREKFHLIKSLAKAIAELHDFNPPLIIRKLHPANVLISKKFVLKVCDFLPFLEADLLPVEYNWWV